MSNPECDTGHHQECDGLVWCTDYDCDWFQPCDCDCHLEQQKAA